MQHFSRQRHPSSLRWQTTSAISGGLLQCQSNRTAVADPPVRELIKIRGKIVSHGRYIMFQMAEVAVSQILVDID